MLHVFATESHGFILFGPPSYLSTYQKNLTGPHHKWLSVCHSGAFVTQHQAARWLGGWHFSSRRGPITHEETGASIRVFQPKMGDSESHGFQYQTRQMTWLIGVPPFSETSMIVKINPKFIFFLKGFAEFQHNFFWTVLAQCQPRKTSSRDRKECHDRLRPLDGCGHFAPCEPWQAGTGMFTRRENSLLVDVDGCWFKIK